MIVQVDPLPWYLKATQEADYNDPSIQLFLHQSGWRDLPDLDKAETVFHFVRDLVRHSWDAQDQEVTFAASEVLALRTGICYAKSNLVTALLRGLGIPTGFCYQRLVLFEEPADGYSLHSLNAAHLCDRWVRFDARGNKAGVNAQFDPKEEKLAFQVRPELGEIDYPGIYAHANPRVVQCLTQAQNAEDMYRRGLPSAL